MSDTETASATQCPWCGNPVPMDFIVKLDSKIWYGGEHMCKLASYMPAERVAIQAVRYLDTVKA